MANILCIDTSSQYCLVSLCYGTTQLSHQSTEQRSHAKELLPIIETLLAQASAKLSDLDAIAVVVGPGSFTGVRIGAGVAQGLAFGANIPLIGLSSLAVMAMSAFLKEGAKQCQVALIARENEIYGASYHLASDYPQLVGSEFVASIERSHFPSLSAHEPIVGVGSGWLHDKTLLANSGARAVQAIYPQIDCDADALSCLAQKYFEQGLASDPELVLPVYVKEEMEYQS
ncbi:MAG: tRNA (adenosine(37)-N6)-threonylcarbamoyltransferase complex dimerization subunit type 1 TsaB [Pseudohongiellaceae bacterium]|nr:tRNA (adenosine(37)-N6)-threonylcarbamoyltransferase complex dimerization subunit type 1 TsaB [Pseudohongiellaceae bacterium]